MTALGGEARLRLLYELGCAFAARLELDELLPLVVAKCRDVLGAEGTAVLLLDPERNELFFPYVADEDPGVAERLAALRFPADRGFAGAAIEAGHAVRVDDAASDPCGKQRGHGLLKPQHRRVDLGAWNHFAQTLAVRSTRLHRFPVQITIREGGQPEQCERGFPGIRVGTEDDEIGHR